MPSHSTGMMMRALAVGLIAHVYQVLRHGDELASGVDLSIEVPSFSAFGLLGLVGELWGFFVELAQLLFRMASFTAVEGMPTWLRIPIAILVNLAVFGPLILMAADVLSSAPGT